MPWGFAAAAVAAAVSAYGAVSEGQAQAQSQKFNAQIAQQNAATAQQNATWATQAGEERAAQQEQKTRATVGALQANQAAAGIDVNSGSAVDVRSSAAELGELDAINIRTDAARQAYGYSTQSTSYNNQSNLDEYAASNDTKAADIKAGATLISAAGDEGTSSSKQGLFSA